MHTDYWKFYDSKLGKNVCHWEYFLSLVVTIRKLEMCQWNTGAPTFPLPQNYSSELCDKHDFQMDGQTENNKSYCTPLKEGT